MEQVYRGVEGPGEHGREISALGDMRKARLERGRKFPFGWIPAQVHHPHKRHRAGKLTDSFPRRRTGVEPLLDVLSLRVAAKTRSMPPIRTISLSFLRIALAEQALSLYARLLRPERKPPWQRLWRAQNGCREDPVRDGAQIEPGPGSAGRCMA